ncbi:heterokaryon incompatibility protein [Rutstroemia sp. NJR-2017a WRK4]|nr:heterokaryon incompatibility protein [Rutstroemia sp. NJR-2017a WRK4]
MGSYRYQPLRSALQEIRLIHLFPGEFEDPIKLRILHSTLPLPPTSPPKEKGIQIDSLRTLLSWPLEIEETEDGDIIVIDVRTGKRQSFPTVEPSLEGTPEFQPRYEALSYTWGGNDVCELAHVQVEGSQGRGETFATLGLRLNLASALRCLRYINEIRILWIDAICINQEDIEERNEQVKRMTNIYTLAHRVIAWLGTESTNSKHALATLHYIGRQLKTTTKGGRIIAAPDATEPNMWRNDHMPSLDQQTWQALGDFVERAWFYRLWCWQEIKLGGKHALIQCGGDMIPWNDFWRAVLCLHTKDSSPSILFRERCRHIVFLKHDAASHSLSNILDISRSKGCVNPRDKIYGLLGITPAYFSTNIMVDYSRPVEEVYKEAFLTHLNATKRLELLKHCDLTNRQIGGPSWVPDWSKTEFAAPILTSKDDPIYSERETTNTIQKIRGRRFLTTEDGHIGTAPAGAQVGKSGHCQRGNLGLILLLGDSICLLLGTYAPMVLRQTSSSTFQVVGECYIHGLADAVGLLGPLPNHWETIIKGDVLGKQTQRFIYDGNGEETLDDPRLEPLPWSWERAIYERKVDDPVIFERFKI